MSSKRGRGRPKSRVGSDNDSEIESQLKEQEDKISKKENIKFLAVLSGKKNEKEGKATKTNQVSDSDSDFETKIPKKRAYKKKELDPEEICDQYIENFKKENDLKLNSYFKKLDQSVKDGFEDLSRNVNSLVRFLKYNSETGKNKAAKQEADDSPIECSPAKRIRFKNEPYIKHQNFAYHQFSEQPNSFYTYPTINPAFTRNSVYTNLQSMPNFAPNFSVNQNQMDANRQSLPNLAPHFSRNQNQIGQNTTLNPNNDLNLGVNDESTLLKNTANSNQLRGQSIQSQSSVAQNKIIQNTASNNYSDSNLDELFYIHHPKIL